jgi:hypothetical protein
MRCLHAFGSYLRYSTAQHNTHDWRNQISNTKLKQIKNGHKRKPRKKKEKTDNGMIVGNDSSGRGGECQCECVCSNNGNSMEIKTRDISQQTVVVSLAGVCT